MPGFRPNPRRTDPPPVYRSLEGYFDLSEEERLAWVTEFLEAINPARRTPASAPAPARRARRWWTGRRHRRSRTG